MKKNYSLPTFAKLKDLPVFLLALHLWYRKRSRYLEERRSGSGEGNGKLVQDRSWEPLVSSLAPLTHRVYASQEQLRQAAHDLMSTELSSGQQEVQVARYLHFIWLAFLQLGLYLLEFLIYQLLPYGNNREQKTRSKSHDLQGPRATLTVGSMR